MRFKNKKEIEWLSHPKNKKELDEYINTVFNHYRSVGFPHFKLTKQERGHIIEHLKQLKTYPLWDNKILKKHNYGYILANYYHPHMQEIRSHVSKSNKVCDAPMDVFNDDEKFKNALYKCISINKYINDSAIRQALKFSGSNIKKVSNFRPTAAKAIYDRYLKTSGVVYDPSMGYGGRILGAMTSTKVLKYIGTDPCKQNVNGIKNFLNDFPVFKHKAKLIVDGSENSNKYISNNTVDLCFTSPPYFNCEIYSNDDNQSWKKYPSKDAWMDSFMFDTLMNCKNMLKKNGYIIINIANVITYPTIEKDFIDLAVNKVGLNLVDTLSLELMNIGLISTGGKNTDSKYEPIFVFQNDGDTDWAKKYYVKKKTKKFIFE